VRVPVIVRIINILYLYVHSTYMPRKGFKTITINEQKHMKLKKISDKTGKDMQEIIEEAIDHLETEVPASE